MKILNLDAYNSDDQIIKLGGKEWKIPAEVPVSFVLQLLDCQQQMNENNGDLNDDNALKNMELLDRQFSIFADIFSIRQPDLKVDQLKKMMTARQMGILINRLVESIATAEEEKKTEVIDEEKTILKNTPEAEKLTE